MGQRARRVLGHRAKLGQRAKSRQRSGHKAIKETEKPFKLNSIKAKLKRTTTVANYRLETYTTREQTRHRPVSQLCHHQGAKSNQSNIYNIFIRI